MGKVREVFSYDASNSVNDQIVPLAPQSSSIGNTLTTTSKIINGTYELLNKKGEKVGILIANLNQNTFAKNVLPYSSGFTSIAVWAFNDSEESYVMTIRYVATSNTLLKPKTKYVSKSIAAGGKYAGKEVIVTNKTDETNVRKVIFEYKN
jgi:hypothetical protein